MGENYPIVRNLVNHRPSEETQNQMEIVRSFVHDLASTFDARLPDGREKSLAFTKLEETTMWAMAALARHDYDKGQA